MSLNSRLKATLGSSQRSKGRIDRFSNHELKTILLILEALDGLGNKYEAHFEKLGLGLALTKEAQYGLRLEIIRPVPSLHRRRQKNSGSVAFI